MVSGGGADVEMSSGPPLDKEALKGHLDELAASIVRVDEYAAQAPSVNDCDDASAAGAALRAADAAAADAVHEELHRLLRKTQVTRRVLGGGGGNAPSSLAAEERAALRARMADLKEAVLRLSAHCALPSLDADTQLLVASHIDALDSSLASFHRTSSAVLLPLRRRDRPPGELPEEADADGRLPLSCLPWATVLSVVVDAFMDGSLIGLFCSLSSRAGLVLALATSVEMSFLGAVYANTVWRAARTPQLARATLILAPPATLVTAAAVGAAVGAAAAPVPALFVAFFSIGAVALLFLVTNELLIEAHEATKDDAAGDSCAGVWLFVGVFAVLQINLLMPLEEAGVLGMGSADQSYGDYR
jgi:zinc transporter ZupT